MYWLQLLLVDGVSTLTHFIVVSPASGLCTGPAAPDYREAASSECARGVQRHKRGYMLRRN
jgi:hypothetical protein